MTISPEPDLGALYGAARARIGALVSGPDVDLDLVVPATPGWRVRDVVAHVSGVARDGTTGNMAGAPGDEWTDAQVRRGEGRSIGDMLEEWSETGALMEAFLSSPAGGPASAAVMDVHTHETDLRHALGFHHALPPDFLAWAGEAMRDGLAAALAEAGLPMVELDASDFEWFRARLGRRTEAEVRSYRWSSPPSEEVLDTFFIFGRARESLGERE